MAEKNVAFHDYVSKLLAKINGKEGVHLVSIHQANGGFGFAVMGPADELGQERAFCGCGHLFDPLQHVVEVMPRSAAEKAGLKRGDHILEVNGVNVSDGGGDHCWSVVERIMASGGKVDLLVERSELFRHN